jgi:carbon storage regulator
MNIVTLSFEEPLIISINGKKVQLIPFQTKEHGLVKFGIQAPISLSVHREEIYLAIKQKQSTMHSSLINDTL